MGGDTSLNAPLKGDEGGESQWQDFLVDSGPLQDELIAEDEESRVRHDLLMSALESLNDREKHILMERRLADEPKTLEELSQVYGVSRERIRQIEVRAFEKLQAALAAARGRAAAASGRLAPSRRRPWRGCVSFSPSVGSSGRSWTVVVGATLSAAQAPRVAHRLGRSGRPDPSPSVLELAVELGAEDERIGRQVHPGEQRDDRAPESRSSRHNW